MFSLRQVLNMGVYCPIILQKFEFDHHPRYALLELPLLYLWLPGKDWLIIKNRFFFGLYLC